VHLDECLIHKWNILLLPLTNYSKVMPFLILFKIISKFTITKQIYNKLKYNGQKPTFIKLLRKLRSILRLSYPLITDFIILPHIPQSNHFIAHFRGHWRENISNWFSTVSNWMGSGKAHTDTYKDTTRVTGCGVLASCVALCVVMCVREPFNFIACSEFDPHIRRIS